MKALMFLVCSKQAPDPENREKKDPLYMQFERLEYLILIHCQNAGKYQKKKIHAKCDKTLANRTKEFYNEGEENESEEKNNEIQI